MNGDPKVLAGLQQGYLKAYPNNDEDAPSQAFEIQRTWDMIVVGRYRAFPVTDAEIRAWTPPEEPSLADRVAELESLTESLKGIVEMFNAELSNVRGDVDELTAQLEDPEPECTICGGTGHTRENCTPEPPAPDDPVCDLPPLAQGCIVCGKTDADGWIYYVCEDHAPAPAEPATLDPVMYPVRPDPHTDKFGCVWTPARTNKVWQALSWGHCRAHRELTYSETQRYESGSSCSQADEDVMLSKVQEELRAIGYEIVKVTR